MSKILLVEDDPVLGRSVVLSLELEKYQVTWAQDLASAVRLNSTEKFELALLDLGLPDGNGLTFCTKLRDAGSRMPVIILTAQSHEDSVVEGFNAGANDYIEKPFKPKVLLARIKHALSEPVRRTPQLRYGDLLLLISERKVFCNENEFELSRREFDILHFLMERAESVVTRENLIAHIDEDGEMFDRTIDSHISRLRAQLKKAGLKNIRITSVYGVGYRLEKKMVA